MQTPRDVARDQLGGPFEGGCFLGAPPTRHHEDEPSGWEVKPRRDVTRVPGAERETRQGERLELEVAVFVRLRPRAGDVTVVVPASHARPIAEHERRGRAGGTCRHRQRCRRGNHGPASRVRASFRADHARKRRARLRGGWKTPTTRWKAPRARASGATTAVRALRGFVRKRATREVLVNFQRAFNERFKNMHSPFAARSRARDHAAHALLASWRHHPQSARVHVSIGSFASPGCFPPPQTTRSACSANGSA